MRGACLIRPGGLHNALSIAKNEEVFHRSYNVVLHSEVKRFRVRRILVVNDGRHDGSRANFYQAESALSVPLMD